MLSTIVFAPVPPLLRPEIARGAASELDELRAALLSAITEATSDADLVVLLGAKESIELGHWMLQTALWAGPTRDVRIGPGPEPSTLADTVERVTQAAETGRTVLLALADGSARRGPKAPGYTDARSFDFDDSVAAALEVGDAKALQFLDQTLARELLAAGADVWPIVGEVAEGISWQSTLSFRTDPYGVSYFVAAWQSQQNSDGNPQAN